MSIASRPRVAVLFDNFGPYHVARLSAAAKHCDLVGIEVAPVSREYAWHPTKTVSFSRETLISEGKEGLRTKGQLFSKLETVIDRYGVDAMVIPGWSGRHAFAAARVALSRSIRLIVMSESQESDAQRSLVLERVKGRFLSICSAALVGGSRHRAYLQKLGMRPSSIFMGYDVVDNDYFRDGASRIRRSFDGSRQRLGLPEKYFLASARFIPKKNLFSLIDAYAHYHKATLARQQLAEDPWHLVLLGDGELRQQLMDHIAKSEVRSFIQTPGFVQYPELPAYYGLAGAFIHASTVEQWGLVVNEAMASGLPVLVSSACGCSADLVKPGVNGFVFDPHDVHQLSQKMGEISRNSNLANAMGQASAQIIQEWGPERFAKGLLESVGCAMHSPAPDVGLVDRWLLSALEAR